VAEEISVVSEQGVSENRADYRNRKHARDGDEYGFEPAVLGIFGFYHLFGTRPFIYVDIKMMDVI